MCQGKDLKTFAELVRFTLLPEALLLDWVRQGMPSCACGAFDLEQVNAWLAERFPDSPALRTPQTQWGYTWTLVQRMFRALAECEHLDARDREMHAQTLSLTRTSASPHGHYLLTDPHDPTGWFLHLLWSERDLNAAGLELAFSVRRRGASSPPSAAPAEIAQPQRDTPRTEQPAVNRDEE